MRENQLPVHYTSAEETERVRPAVDSGDGGVHIPRERVTQVDARPVGNYLADDSSNSVHITLAHCCADGSASATTSAVAVDPRALPGSRNQYVDPEHCTKLEAERNSRLGTWLLASAVISVTTLYTICNPKWVPSSVAQTVNLSKQLSADIKKTASTPLGGTDVADTAKAGAGTVVDAAGIHGAPTGRNSASAVQPKGETAGVTRNSVVRGVRPAAPASLRDVSQGFTFPVTETRKAAEAKTSKSKKGFMVPPPPPTPCVLPPAFGFYTAPQQQLQEGQAQASPKTNNQDAARENTPQQPTEASSSTEATQSAALVGADQELQAALSSSLRTVDEWKR